jgi:hypothetical protein
VGGVINHGLTRICTDYLFGGFGYCVVGKLSHCKGILWQRRGHMMI